MSKSNKPQVTKTAVIVKAAMGESKSQIAEDLNIARDTVRRILSEAEFATLAAQAKSGVFLLVPKALKALEGALDKGDVTEAKMILRSVGALPAQDGAAVVNFDMSFGDLPTPGDKSRTVNKPN